MYLFWEGGEGIEDVYTHCLPMLYQFMRDKSVSGISPGSFSAEKTFLSSPISL